MSRKAELTVKLVDQAVSKLGRTFPEGAVKYDLVKGVSKKGNFSIFSFKDSSGRLIRRESVFDNAGNVTREWRTYNHYSVGRNIDTYVSKNNNEYELLNERFIHFDPTKSTKDAWMFDRNPIVEDCLDTHVISYLSPAKKAKKLSFSTFYDGRVPSSIKSSYTGEQVLAKRNREYLPLVTTEYMGNVEQKVSHISALQEKKFNLKEILPPIEQVPHESIQHSVNSVTNGTVWGNCNIYTGQIKYSDELYYGRKLLDTLAHEYKHASDASKIYRLQSNVDELLSIPKEEIAQAPKEIVDQINFARKSMRNGVIKNNTKGGQRVAKMEKNWEIEEQIPYFERPQENRAFRASAEQLQRYDSCWNSVGKLFDAKFIPPKVS